MNAALMAALILVISFAALLQFFVSYCRSLIASCRMVELSAGAREVAGIEDQLVYGDDFERLLQLVGLCPETRRDGFEIRAVRVYYSLLNSVRAAARSLAPGVAAWADLERAGCAYFAAVTLDRRIAHNRDLMAQQMSR